MPPRATRSKATPKAKPSPRGRPKSEPKSRRSGGATKVQQRQDGESEEEVEGSILGGAEDDNESEPESLHSDALDDEEPPRKKRKRTSSSSSPKKTVTKKAPAKKSTPKKASTSSPKKRKTEESDDEDEDDLELAEGQEIVGVVVQAPKTGRVPPGQISKNTLNFLSELKKPECNDREWFKLHGITFPLPPVRSVRMPVSLIEPVYRLAENEWKAFIEQFTDLLVEVDPQIPHLPPKDVIHRIYRDIRFSNDKTPYKTGFSASFSRSGRKGIFAALKPGGESLIAAGAWCPGKNELQTIRNNLLRSSTRFRRIIAAPEFEALFGPARPHPEGGRQNVFGFEDELKVAPKGVDKTHKDIDLLKCRSFAVIHKFTDEQVLAPDFGQTLADVVKVVRPFVHCLNDLMTIQNAGSSDEEDEEDDEREDDEADEE
ncbi:hypothetical protein C8Q79DRAFT_1006142 [Trametes meyenii]|nr:hypothetical protein C8Q79DRAFT_1006142 [Trametes meyenii]